MYLRTEALASRWCRLEASTAQATTCFDKTGLNFPPKLNLKKTHLVDKGAAEVGQGDALDEPGVEAEEVVDGVGVVPEAVLLGQDGEGGLQEGLEHVEEAGDAGAAEETGEWLAIQ